MFNKRKPKFSIAAGYARIFDNCCQKFLGKMVITCLIIPLFLHTKEPPEDDNFEVYIQYESTRKAIHVGERPFGAQGNAVYRAMIEDFMKPQREDVEFLLERYKVNSCSIYVSKINHQWAF